MIPRFFIAVLILCTVYPAEGLAQRNIGVIWEVPNNVQTARDDLQSFKESGINYLQVNHELDNETWDLISEFEFGVYAMLSVRFPVVQTYANADSSFKQKTKQSLNHFLDKETVEAVGMFSYGQVENSRFQKSFYDFLKEIKLPITNPIYYQTTKTNFLSVDSLFSFKLVAVSGNAIPVNSETESYLYQANHEKKWRMEPVKVFLEQTAHPNGRPVFFDGAWLQSMQQKHPDFRKKLMLYATSAEPAFALPREQNNVDPGHNSAIIALLIIWFLFALTYHNSPVFRKSMVRYFTGHTFFIDDVMQRHIRTPLPGTSILTQHTIAGGILFYCLFQTAFSPLGFEALTSHYPLFKIFGTGSLSIFFMGMLFTLFFELICLAWLRIVHTEITHLSQLLNLYPWPLQTNLLSISLVLALFLSGQPAVFVYITASIFTVISLSAFVITAFDSNSYASSNKLWLLLGTVGIYAAILVGCSIWIIASTNFTNIISLAISMPK